MPSCNQVSLDPRRIVGEVIGNCIELWMERRQTAIRQISESGYRRKGLATTPSLPDGCKWILSYTQLSVRAIQIEEHEIFATMLRYKVWMDGIELAACSSEGIH